MSLLAELGCTEKIKVLSSREGMDPFKATALSHLCIFRPYFDHPLSRPPFTSTPTP